MLASMRMNVPDVLLDIHRLSSRTLSVIRNSSAYHVMAPRIFLVLDEAPGPRHIPTITHDPDSINRSRTRTSVSGNLVYRSCKSSDISSPQSSRECNKK